MDLVAAVFGAEKAKRFLGKHWPFGSTCILRFVMTGAQCKLRSYAITFGERRVEIKLRKIMFGLSTNLFRHRVVLRHFKFAPRPRVEQR